MAGASGRCTTGRWLLEARWVRALRLPNPTGTRQGWPRALPPAAHPAGPPRPRHVGRVRSADIVNPQISARCRMRVVCWPRRQPWRSYASRTTDDRCPPATSTPTAAATSAVPPRASSSRCREVVSTDGRRQALGRASLRRRHLCRRAAGRPRGVRTGERARPGMTSGAAVAEINGMLHCLADAQSRSPVQLLRYDGRRVPSTSPSPLRASPRPGPSTAAAFADVDADGDTRSCARPSGRAAAEPAPQRRHRPVRRCDQAGSGIVGRVPGRHRARRRGASALARRQPRRPSRPLLRATGTPASRCCSSSSPRTRPMLLPAGPPPPCAPKPLTFKRSVQPEPALSR